MSWLSSWWNNEPARDAAERAQETANANATAAMTATEKANKEALDFQKVLAYLQARMSNQSNAQSLAATLAGQQQGLNQYAQLYNQDQTNRLPYQMASLSALQALTPLMQMTGLQGYQLPTSIDTTKLQAPDVVGQFQSLADYFSRQGEQQLNPNAMLAAFSDPATYLASAGRQTLQVNGVPIPMTNQVTTYGGKITLDNGKVYDSEAYRQWIAATGNPVGTIPPAVSSGATGTGAATPSLASVLPGAAATMTSLTPATSTYNPLAGNPEYDYLLSQAQRTLSNKLAARGMTGSGAAAKMATDTTLGMARDEMDRRRKQLTDIYGLAMGWQPQATGQQAGSTLAQMTAQGGQNTASALQNAAQNRSGLYSGLANAASSAAQAGGANLSNYYNAMTQNAMNLAGAKSQMTTGADQLWSLGKSLALGGLGSGLTSAFGNLTGYPTAWAGWGR